MRFDTPGEMSWGEIWRLTQELSSDPSSHVFAALAGWDFPVSWEWILAADAYDVAVAAAGGGTSGRPHPRPWDKEPEALGAGSTMTVAEYRALRERIDDRE